VILLEVLWWAGWVWFAAWAALPLAALPALGPVAGVVAWAVLAPWSALLGMAGVHRLLPASREGRFRMFADRGSVRWALNGWAPSVYLTVFQPVFFLTPGFARVALRAFGARLGPGARVTTRTSIREPHLVRIGRNSLVGEYVHLVCSYQPRTGLLHVEGIVIGDDVLIGAHGVLAPGARVGDRSVVEYGVTIGARSTVGADARIGANTCLYNGVRVGDGVHVGKGCHLLPGSVVPDGTRIGDGVVWPAAREAEGAG
jgi:acetyltransferase-like isoleucine patch superfamily enzyme